MLIFRSLQKQLLLALPLFFITHVFVQGHPISPTNGILQDGIIISAGTDVVLESIIRLTVEDIVNDENQFLRIIAYVETQDGLSMATQGESECGGIWAVSKSSFHKTQAINVGASIKSTLQQIKQKLSIDWTTVEWYELSNPLYSAIAAHLVLSLISSTMLAPPPYNDVAGQAQYWKIHYNQNGSAEEFVHAVNKLEGSVFKNSGFDFYVGFPRNILEANQKLLISTHEREPTHFTVQAMSGFHFAGTAVEYSTIEVDLGDYVQVQNKSDRHKGIHIISSGSKTIVVYGLNYHQYTTDTFLALPCSRHLKKETRYEYFALSYGNASGPNQVLLVACEDNTTVTFEKSSIALNEMETYLKEDTADITGAKFVSNKPISFYSGHLCAYIPNNVPACDHIIEQLPPTIEWGREFLLASLYGRVSSDLYRIVNSVPSNVVKICCNNPENLKSYKYQLKINVVGEWEELVLPSGYFCAVQSKHPVLVAQFGLGHKTDHIGDPFMMMIPAIEQYSNHYTISALSDFSVNYITILVPLKHFEPARIYVDKSNLLHAKWNAVYSHNGVVCGYATYVTLDEGNHRVYHINPLSNIGILVYGFDLYNSYGHPAGLEYIPQNSTVISFSQDVYTVNEVKGSITISLLCSNANTGVEKTVVMIGSRPSHSSATEGTDYIPVNQLIVFGNDEFQKEVEIEIINDDDIEETEAFILYLSGGDNIQLTPYKEAEIRIIDNDPVTVSEYYVDSGPPSVHVEDEAVIERGSQVSIYWSPTTFSNTNFSVDITLCVLAQHVHLQCIPLATSVANTGHAIVTLPLSLLASHDSLKYPLLPIVFRVNINIAHFHPSPNCSLSQRTKPGCEKLHVTQQSHVRLLNVLSDRAVQRLACQVWFDTEPSSDSYNTALLNKPLLLLLCPCTEQHVLLPDSGFKKEQFTYFPLPNDTLQHLKDNQSHKWMIDETFNDFLASTCYRSAANGSSYQQCCYDTIGNLMINTRDSSPRIPDQSLIHHLRYNTIPRWLCCRYDVSSDCELYYQKRFLDECSQNQT